MERGRGRGRGGEREREGRREGSSIHRFTLQLVTLAGAVRICSQE